MRGCFTELAAQPREMHIDCAIFTSMRLVPDLGEEFALGHDPTAPYREVMQQIELFAGEVELPTGQGCSAVTSIDLKVADRDRPAFFD